MGGAGDAAKDYAAGFAAGIATVVTGHPFDTVKVKLQAHNTKGKQKVYNNAFHCAIKTLRNEGIKGIYRGASSAFIGMAFESSLIFGIYSQMTHALQGKTERNSPQLEIIVPSAGFGGAVISFILCPSELIKCRMQVQGCSSATFPSYPRYNGPLDCALQTVKSEGIHGLFRGGSATLLRESIGNAVFFSTYEFTRYFMRSHLNPDSLGLTSSRQKLFLDIGSGIFSGGLAGMAFWSAVLPIDVAKTVIQTSSENNSCRSPLWTIQAIYRTVGFRGCYAGLGPTLLRAFPANAAAIVTWEFTAKLLGLKRVHLSE
ncbi:mitochondrial substrate carrier family protein [Wolffia australiana]